MDEKKFLIIVFVLASLFNIIISFFVELWPLGGDPIDHYKWSLKILDGNFPIDRTFLYNGILSVFLYFNHDYWVAQVVNAFISNLFLIPLYYIAKNQFNKKIAIQSVILICIVPFQIFGIAPTPKLLAVFFIFISYYFVLKKDYSWWIAIASTLAFLTHQYSLFFLMPAFLLIFKKNWKRSLLLSSLLIVAVTSWMTFNPGSVFIYYPIAVNGWMSVMNTPPEIIWANFYSTPWYKIIGVRIVNFFIPITPLLFPVVKTIDIIHPIVLHLYKIINFSTQPWAYHYLQSFSGHVGILLYIFAILGLWKLRKTNLVFLIVLSYVVCVLFFGWINLFISSVGLVFAPLLTIISVSQVNKTKNMPRWMMIIFFSLLIEFFLMFITFGWFIEFIKKGLITSGLFGDYANLNSLWKLVH